MLITVIISNNNSNNSNNVDLQTEQHHRKKKYALTFSHFFVFPSTTFVIVRQPVLLRLSFYHFMHRLDFVLSWNCISTISTIVSLQSFSLFYNLIASYYTKGKWQWRQGYLFCVESYHFDKKMFPYICLFFSS